MGNCCEPASSMQWDWSDLLSKKAFHEGRGLCLGKVQKEKLMEGLRVSPDANGKVKIKISKKELAELLQNQQQQVNNRQLSSRVLLRLIKATYSWTPVLDSIPDLN